MMKIAYLVRQDNYGWDGEPDEEEYPWELRSSRPSYAQDRNVKRIVYCEVEED